MYFVRTYKNSKIPYACDWSGKKVSNFKKDIRPCADYNTSTICGKINDITVVDLDSYKWKDDNHIFYKTFGKDFIKTFNTYTVKTASGGYHLYFKYVDLPNINSKELEIDVRMIMDLSYLLTLLSTVTSMKLSVRRLSKECLNNSKNSY